MLMPAVMRFNKRVNAGKQATVLGVLKGEGSVRALLVGARRAGGVAPGGSVRGQDGPDGEEGDAEEDLAYVLDVIFRALGLPRSLKEVGVGRGELPLLAEGSLDDRWCKTNPVPLRESGQVMEILEMVVGDQ